MSQSQSDIPHVVDTCVYLAAAAAPKNNHSGTNSKLDQQTRAANMDPAKILGALAELSLRGKLIVPQTVCQELRGFLKSPKLSDQNKQTLTKILGLIEPIAIKVIPSQEDLKSQQDFFLTIQEKANKHIDSLRKRGYQIPSRWDRVNSQNQQQAERDRHQDTSIPQIPQSTLTQIHSNPHARLWSKISTEQPKLTTTFSSSTPSPSTSTVQSPGEAYLLPDFAIFLTAQKHQARLITIDADFMLLHHEIDPTLPKPILNPQYVPLGIEDYIKKLKQSIKHHYKTDPPPPPRPKL